MLRKLCAIATVAVLLVLDAPAQVAGKPALQEGTPVRLRLSRNLSSADAHVNDSVDFEVLEEIKVGDLIVVPKGATAIGTVTEAKPKGRMSKGGKLAATIDYVRLADGEKAALRGVREGSGGGHTGAMTGGIVAASLIVWPAAPFFLFMHGKDITIPKGTEITAYVNGDMTLDAAKFSAVVGPGQGTAAAAASGAPAAGASAGNGSLVVASTPAGADIEIDGAYVGSTPSTVPATVGDHTITIKKSGYADWSRKIRVAGGSVNVSASLEKKAEAGK